MQTPKRSLWLLSICVLLPILVGSCTLREDTHYKVTTGTKLYAWFFARPSWQISGLIYKEACNRNIACTSDLLAEHTNLQGWGAAEFYDGIRDYTDFWPAVDQVYGWGFDAARNAGRGCLVLTKSLSGNLDWLAETTGRDDCKIGTYYS